MKGFVIMNKKQILLDDITDLCEAVMCTYKPSALTDKKKVLAVAKTYGLDADKLLKWQEKVLLIWKKYDAQPGLRTCFDSLPLHNKLEKEFVKTFFPEFLKQWTETNRRRY